METCFHGNRPSQATNHYFTSLYSKYQSPCFICFSILLAPSISSLDEIYCNLSYYRLLAYFFGMIWKIFILNKEPQIYCKTMRNCLNIDEIYNIRPPIRKRSLDIYLIHGVDAGHFCEYEEQDGASFGRWSISIAEFVDVCRRFGAQLQFLRYLTW